MNTQEAIQYIKEVDPEAYREIYRLVWNSRWAPTEVAHAIYNRHQIADQIVSPSFYQAVELVAHQAWRDIPLGNCVSGLVQSRDDCLRS